MHNTTELVTYTFPRSCPRSATFQLAVNGEPLFVHRTNVADFSVFSFAGAVMCEITVSQPIRKAVVRPANRGITPEIDGNRLRFTLPYPQCVSVEIDGLNPLFIYGNPLETNIPSPDDPTVHYFKAGQVYEVGELHLQSGDTLYIEGGAVVKGCLRATNARDIRICGRGVLDGSYYRRGIDGTRTILLAECEDVLIEDITLIEPTTWMIQLGNCRGIIVRNIKEIGEVIGSDGVDVVGSRDILIEDCFFRNNDDCVVLKGSRNFQGLVENILVQRVFTNARGGNAIEIGYETQTDAIRNVTFRDIDVLSVHGHGAVFAIHNGDRAIVSDITYQDIRVEHCYDKIIDFRVLHSRWNRDEQHGQVRNILLKNIRVTATQDNPGYTISVIGGWDADHTVDGVTIEDFYINDTKITTPDALDLYLKHAHHVVIK